MEACAAAPPNGRGILHRSRRRVRRDVVQDRNGKFENRASGASACYHRIEDQAGNPADEFRCDLVIPIGEALGE